MRKVLGFSAALAGCAMLQSLSFAQSPYAPNKEIPLATQAPAMVQAQQPAEKMPDPAPEPVPAPKPDAKPEPTPPTPAVIPEPDHHPVIAVPSYVNAPPADGGDYCNDYCFRIYGDFLYLKERGSDLAFVQARDGCGATSVPRGAQGSLEVDYSPGFRIGGEFEIDKCSGIQAEFSWWEDQTHDHVIETGTPILQSLLTLPSTTSCSTSSKEARATFATEFRTGDIAYTRVLCGDGHCYVVRWLAGAYYAHLNQDLHSEFAILGTTSVDTHINFDGFGPRVGLDGEVNAGCGVYLYGRGTANLVAGHFTGSFEQISTFGGNQGNITFRDDRVVPILDMELGVGWASPKGHVRALVGYSVAGWFNSLLTPEFINAVQANNFTHQGDNLSNTLWFDGLLARLEFRY